MARPGNLLLPPTVAAAAILAAGAAGIAAHFRGDPGLLLGQLAVLTIALGTTTWTLRRALADALWWLPTALFAWATLAPIEPWLPHATGDGFACGRLMWIPTTVGDAYLAWIESLAYGVPAALLVAGSALAAWRQRSWELAAWTMVGALAVAVMWTAGRPHDCD